MYEIGARPSVQDTINNDNDDDDEFIQWNEISQSSKLKQGSEYSQSRRVFLNSYHFRVEKTGMKEKMRKSVKEMNEAAMEALMVIRREVGKRRIGIRIFRVRISLSSHLFLVNCFMPWFSKMK